MSLLALELDERVANPVDVVEHVADERDWAFDRSCDDEIAISVAGAWSDYHVSFTWRDDMEALHVACAFDFKVPDAGREKLSRLLSLINEQLWMGHFDYWENEGAVIFRHGVLLTNGAIVNSGQCEGIVQTAVQACETYYQAFQFLAWAGKSPEDALRSVLFETKGTA
ncbi:MAG: YbjN domain-containing protein [Pseudomonadota bacterium]